MDGKHPCNLSLNCFLLRFTVQYHIFHSYSFKQSTEYVSYESTDRLNSFVSKPVREELHTD